MPPVKLFFCVILLTGFLRLILHRNFKIALVLGVVCIGVKGFFFGFFLLHLLAIEVEAATRRQYDQSHYAQKAGCDLCDLVFLGLFRTGCCRFFGGILDILLSLFAFQLCLYSRLFFSGISIGIFFLHQSQKVTLVHQIHKVNSLLPFGVAVDDQIKGGS